MTTTMAPTNGHVEETWLTAAEVTQRLGCTPENVYGLLKKEKIPGAYLDMESKPPMWKIPLTGFIVYQEKRGKKALQPEPKGAGEREQILSDEAQTRQEPLGLSTPLLLPAPCAPLPQEEPQEDTLLGETLLPSGGDTIPNVPLETQKESLGAEPDVCERGEVEPEVSCFRCERPLGEGAYRIEKFTGIGKRPRFEAVCADGRCDPNNPFGQQLAHLQAKVMHLQQEKRQILEMLISLHDLLGQEILGLSQAERQADPH